MSTTVLPPLSQVDPARAWQPWQPSAGDPWSLKWAGHLFRRAGFGAPLPRLRQAVAEGVFGTLNRLLEGDPFRSRATRT